MKDDAFLMSDTFQKNSNNAALWHITFFLDFKINNATSSQKRMAHKTLLSWYMANYYAFSCIDSILIVQVDSFDRGA